MMQPVSLENELKVLRTLLAFSEAALTKYPTTLEEDYAILQSTQLTENQENCVLMRSGEKEVLHWWIEFTREMVNILQQDLNSTYIKNVKKKLKNHPYEPYFVKVLLPLLRANP